MSDEGDTIFEICLGCCFRCICECVCATLCSTILDICCGGDERQRNRNVVQTPPQQTYIPVSQCKQTMNIFTCVEIQDEAIWFKSFSLDYYCL